MKIVVVKSPKALCGLLKTIFGLRQFPFPRSGMGHIGMVLYI